MRNQELRVDTHLAESESKSKSARERGDIFTVFLSTKPLISPDFVLAVFMTGATPRTRASASSRVGRAKRFYLPSTFFVSPVLFAAACSPIPAAWTPL